MGAGELRAHALMSMRPSSAIAKMKRTPNIKLRHAVVRFVLTAATALRVAAAPTTSSALKADPIAFSFDPRHTTRGAPAHPNICVYAYPTNALVLY